jgi:hypothetical protein
MLRRRPEGCLADQRLRNAATPTGKTDANSEIVHAHVAEEPPTEPRRSGEARRLEVAASEDGCRSGTFPLKPGDYRLSLIEAADIFVFSW